MAAISRFIRDNVPPARAMASARDLPEPREIHCESPGRVRFYRNLKVTSIAVWTVRSRPASPERQAAYYRQQAAIRRRILLLIPLGIASWALFIGLGIGIYELVGMLLQIGN
jgi:hypothetical protein